jgi:hypothetical protein
MKQTWKIILVIIITATIVGGGVYYWQSQTSTKVSETKIDNGSEISQYLPRIAYIAPGKFTDEEKNMLQNNLIAPYAYYFETKGDPLVAMIIDKVGSDLPVYSIEAVHKIQHASFGFGPIKGKTTNLEDYPVWCPVCYFSDCEGEISDAFKNKYPEIYNSALKGCVE